jgi:hypothetical protein
MAPELTAPITRVPLYHKRWFKRVVVAIVAALTVGALIAVILFLSWWNSPEKALLDAGDYMVKTPGLYHVSSRTMNLDVVIREYEYEAKGTLNGITIDAIYFGGNLYVKSPDPDALYKFFMGVDDSAKIPTVVQSIIPTVKDKWISINLQNVTLGSQNVLRMKCISEEREAISHSPDARRQWAATYLAHRFMNITTTKQGDQSLYQLSINGSARVDFFTALLKTSFYQSLLSCSKDSDILQNVPSSKVFANITLSQPQHIPKSFVISPNTDITTTVTTNYLSVPDITIPTDAVSSDQLVIRYLQSIGQTITP